MDKQLLTSGQAERSIQLRGAMYTDYAYRLVVVNPEVD